MDIKEFNNISLRGRVAFAIKCFENLLLEEGYSLSEWEVIFDYLWNFTSTNDFEEWGDRVVEMIPENLLEFNNYEEGNFEYLESEIYLTLKRLYNNICDDINFMIKQIYYLGTSHAYSCIVGHGESSLIELKMILDLMNRKDIKDPSIQDFYKFCMSEDNGWGYPFMKQQISERLF